MMSRQLCPETSWAFTRNRLMENISTVPSQGGWLGRAFVGPASTWSLEGETEIGPGRVGRQGFTQHLLTLWRRSWVSTVGAKTLVQAWPFAGGNQ